jgi:hypothetical protein
VRGRTHEGTGIGLALVQELVRLHGGSIRVDSIVGKGSTFVVSMGGLSRTTGRKASAATRQVARVSRSPKPMPTLPIRSTPVIRRAGRMPS